MKVIVKVVIEIDNKIKKRLTVFGIAYIVSMFTKWFGTGTGMDETYDTIVLINPITIISLVCLFAGIWINNYKNSLIFSLTGSFILIIMEIYYFMTRHIMFMTGVFSIQTSIGLAYPMFYVGIGLAIIFFSLSYIFNQ